jgi:PH domain
VPVVVVPARSEILVLFVDYQFGIQLTADGGSRVLGTYCARNERDRAKFVEDLEEAILEVSLFAAITLLSDL